jgi:hypothetical protein
LLPLFFPAFLASSEIVGIEPCELCGLPPISQAPARGRALSFARKGCDNPSMVCPVGRWWRRACSASECASGCIFLAIALLVGCRHVGGQRAVELFEESYDDSLVVATSTLPPAVTGREYSFNLQARGQPKPYSWRLASGQLPEGLQLDDDGEILGTPLAPGTATFVVKVAGPAPLRASKRGASPHVYSRLCQLTLKVVNASASATRAPAEGMSRSP